MQFIDLKTQFERIEADVCKRVDEVLHSQRYIMGPQIAEMEEKLAAYAGTKYAFSCSSGTDALVIPLMAYDLAKDDAVFVPSFTFFASGESVTLAGGTPVFVDSDPDSARGSRACHRGRSGGGKAQSARHHRGRSLRAPCRLWCHKGHCRKTRPVRAGRCSAGFWGQQSGQACRQLRQCGGHLVFPCQAAWVLR